MYIKPLTFLRFVASISVVIFHYAAYNNIAPFSYPPFQPLTQLMKNGNIFVAFFFILSGFIQAYIYAGVEKFSNKAYYLNRVLKLYPTYLIALLLAYQHVPIIALKSILMNLFVLTGWTYDNALNDANPISWSLSAEFFFYALFPVLLKELKGKKNWSLLIFAIICVLLLWLIELPYQGVYLPMVLRPAIYTLPLFIVGVVIGILFNREQSSAIRWANKNQFFVHFLAGVGIVFLFVAVNLWRFDWFESLWFFSVVFTIIILGTCLMSEQSMIGKALSSKVAFFLGEISYGIYIYQLPIYALLMPYLHSLMNRHYAFYAYLFVLMSIASISYWLMDKLYKRFRR